MKGVRVLHLHRMKGVSGSERHLFSLVSHLDRVRFKPACLLFFTAPSPELTGYAEAIGEAGVEVFTLPFPRHVSLTAFIGTIRIMRRIRPDIVHTHLIHADLYGAVSARLAGVRYVVCTKHGYDSYERPSRLYRINGFLSRSVDRVVTISDGLQPFVSRIEGIQREKMITVHYGLESDYANLPKGNGIRRELGVREDTFLMATVARLIPVKAHHVLLEALAKLGPRLGEWGLVIVGEGPLREELVSLTQRLHIQNNVYFLGRRTDVPQILSEIDLFVLPTLGEGFGLVLLEAMAFSRAIVCSKVMGCSEVVADGETGILVSPQDPDALAAAILRLHDCPSLRKEMGARGRARLDARFSVRRMVRETERLYESLLNSREESRER